MPLLIAIVAAGVPTVIYSLLLWWLDRYEKEPVALLLIAFLWGAVPAIALAVLFEFILGLPFDQTPIGPNIKAIGIAPLVEEPLKALALVGLFRWARAEFDGALDGIVYGALIGFGFAMTENALYFLYYDADVGGLFWVRAVLFGLNHALFSSIVGLAIGTVRYRYGLGLKLGAFAAGLAGAILFHAAHNYFVGFAAGGLLLSSLLQWSGVLVILAVAALAWRHERRCIEDELGDELRAGVLSASDYHEVTSSLRRGRRQLNELLNGDWQRFRQVRRLHHLLTELAFCRARQRQDRRADTASEQEQLRRAIIGLRAALTDTE